ncbi:MAG: hypothetical protein R6V05_00210 [Candidatus Brocadiia bacterium]
MHVRRRYSLTAILALLLISVPISATRAGGPEHYSDPARFVVTTDVVQQDIPPFTATAGAFGNSLLRSGGGFEPVVWRHMFLPNRDSPDRVLADQNAFTRWDTLREGFLDGASVRVYRIVNGTFRLVREGRIPEGGYHCSGWLSVTGDGKLVPAGSTEYTFKWAGYNRPDVPYYFTVTAVDESGAESAFAQPVHVVRPDEVARENPDNTLTAFKPAKENTDESAPSAPDGLRGQVLENGNYRLSWNGVRASDLAGYRIYRSDYAPEHHKGFYAQLAQRPQDPGKHIKAGDMVIVSKKFYSFSRNRYHSNRVWGAGQANHAGMPGLVGFYPDEDPHANWRLVPHAEDSPVPEGGETCLKLELKEGASRQGLATYNHSGTGQTWYEVLETKPYKVEVWLRHDGEGKKPVRFSLNGFYGDKIEPIEFQATSRWQKHEATFTPPVVQDGSRANQMRLQFRGPGTYYVDNFRVYRADTAYLDLLPRDHEAFRRSGMTALRTHGPIKTGTSTYSMEQYTNAGGAIEGVRLGNTLPQMLRVMRDLGVRPWLQVEMHMSPREWQGLVEYLAAPYDPATDSPESKPWACKRYRQGQQRPWVEEFDSIWFELSNETWNWLFSPWIFHATTDAATGEKYGRGEVYGMYQEYVRSVMKESPYWDQADLDEKLVFVLGGWSGQRYGRQAASRSPHSQYMTIAAYNGGWDEGEGPPQLTDASFFNVLAQVNQTAIPRADRHLRERLRLKREEGVAIELGTYEAGPGYALNGLNNARVTKEQARQQELVMKSLTAGTATLDSFLARAYRTFRTQNFFTFSRGPTWSSHAEWYRGGQAYPCWVVLELFNQHATGDMLRTETVSCPSMDLRGFRRRKAVEDAPLAAVYATREGDRVGLFIVSRKIPDYPVTGDDGYTPVTVELPFSEVESITLYRMAGDARANNFHERQVEVETEAIPVTEFSAQFRLNEAPGAEDRGLPPAATFLYVFEGVNAPQGRPVPPSSLVPQE